MIKTYDVVIVGGGPAGLACAIKLKGSGLRVALVEKENFPKQPVCGDGLTEDIVRQLPKISDSLNRRFHADESAVGVRYVDLNMDKHHTIRFQLKRDAQKNFKVYTCPREKFDMMLFEEAEKVLEVDFYLNCKVNKVEIAHEGVTVFTNLYQFSASVVVAADGNNSVVTRNMQEFKKELKQSTVLYPAVQAYYRGINGIELGSIRLFFVKPLLPYYFWIFPLSDGRYNVGLGMKKSKATSLKTDLRTLLEDLVKSHPEIAPFFKNAERVSAIKGRPLALSAWKHSLSGYRFILTGDAAGVVNYFTGEGVGNALRTGRLAAEKVVECFKFNRFDVSFMKSFDNTFYKYSQNEILKARLYAVLFSKVWVVKLLMWFVKKNTGKSIS